MSISLPKVDSLVVAWLQHDIVKVFNKSFVGNIEWDIDLSGRIDSHSNCHLRIHFFVWLNKIKNKKKMVSVGIEPETITHLYSTCWMKIQSVVESFRLAIVEESSGVGK